MCLMRGSCPPSPVLQKVGLASRADYESSPARKVLPEPFGPSRNDGWQQRGSLVKSCRSASWLNLLLPGWSSPAGTEQDVIPQPLTRLLFPAITGAKGN